MAVDDLFSGDPTGGLLPDPTPSLRRAVRAAAVMVILGPCCCTGPLGAAVAIYGWARAGDAIARAEAGLHAPEVVPRARSLRAQAFGLMSVSVLSLLAQSFLWGWGVYPALYRVPIEWLLSALAGAG